MTRKRLYAPQTDRTVVADPPPETWAQMLAANRLRLADANFSVQGRSFRSLRRQAQEDALALARRYTGWLLEVCDTNITLPESLSGPVVLTGHQPELFHPGVWIKNFAAERLARVVDGISVNLVVDNDRIKSLSVRVPVGPPRSPRQALVQLDRWEADVPYEEHVVLDLDTFRVFGSRVATAARTLGLDPLVEHLWEYATKLSERSRRLSDRVSGARRAIEALCGLRNLELPVSKMCSTEPFAWFAAHLIANIDRFHQTHNDALRRYRELYGIRNRSRPVPDLTRDGDWYELPFWVWHVPGRRRMPLYACVRRDRTTLTDRQGWVLDLPLGPERDACRAVERLMPVLRGTKTKIRTRALTTTLFARLFLGDLFVHGLGGAIYDQITDELICRFYELPVPEFATLTATVYLPVERPAVRAEDIAAVKQRLRLLLFNPQKVLPSNVRRYPSVAELIRRKEELIRWQPRTKKERRERFLEFRAINSRLAEFLAAEIEAARLQLAALEHDAKARRILEYREYPFCVYPLEYLVTFYERFCDRIRTTERLPSR